MRMYLYFILAGLISGCSTTAPAVHEYTIYPETRLQSPQQSEAVTVTTRLRIASGKAIPSLQTKNLIYLRPNFESGNYLYTRWSDIPTQMIERSLISTLQKEKIFSAVFSANSASSADWTLESDLNGFYHRFQSQTVSEGVIDITLRLLDTKSKSLIATKRFVITKEAPSNDAQGGIQALSEATRIFNAEAAQWIREKVNP